MSRIPSFNPLQVMLPIGDLAAGAQQFSGLTGDPANDLAALGRNYAQSYGGALNMNSALAQNIQQGYQSILGDTTAANDALARGYADLSGRVLGGLSGAEASQRADLGDAYQRANADSQQSLINRGLGNTTVADSMQRANLGDFSRASTNLANQFAQTRAGYQSDLGLAGLAQQGRGIDQSLGLGRDFLSWLNTIQAPYPDSGQYAQLAQQAGMAQQANADRDILMRQIAAQQSMANQGKPRGGLASSGVGGGMMGSTGRGLSGPMANYAGGATYGGPGGMGGMVGAPSPSAQTYGYIGAPSLTGAGGGYVDATAYAGGGATGEISTTPQVGYTSAGAGAGGSASGEIGGLGGGFGDYLGGMFGY